MPKSQFNSSKHLLSDVLSVAKYFDRQLDITCICNLDSEVLYGNKAFLKFFPCSKKDIDHRKLTLSKLNLVTEDKSNPFQTCLESKKFLSLREVSGTREKGGQISIHLGLQPLFNSKEEVNGFLVSIQDKSLELNLHLQYKSLVEKIEADFDESSLIFTSILEMTDPGEDHYFRVSKMAKKIAEHLGMTNKQIKDIGIAARLHDIGKLGMSQNIKEKNFAQMSEIEKAEYQKHPILGSLLFEGIDSFKEICSFIKTHHEEYDGNGFPDGLKGNKVPIGGYIVGLANDFCHLVQNENDDQQIYKAIKTIQSKQEIKYHPLVIDALMEVIDNKHNFIQQMYRKKITLDELKRGMTLASDLRTKKGILLLQAEEKVTNSSLTRIHHFHSNDPICQDIEIYTHVDEKELQRRKREAAGKHKYNVLVVEDTTDLNFLLCSMIEQNKSFKAIGAENGMEALKMCMDRTFDCILMDLMMPEMDGLTAVEKIRERGIQTPVIMCTAKNDGESIIKAFKLGADEYMTKPILKEPLMDILGAFIGINGGTRENYSVLSQERKKKLLTVLKEEAPDFLVRKAERKQTSPVSIMMQLIDMNNMDIENLEKFNLKGMAESITRYGLECLTEHAFNINQKVAFYLKREGENKFILRGLAKISGKQPLENNESQFLYQFEFTDLSKP